MFFAASKTCERTSSSCLVILRGASSGRPERGGLEGTGRAGAGSASGAGDVGGVDASAGEDKDKRGR